VKKLRFITLSISLGIAIVTQKISVSNFKGMFSSFKLTTLQRVLTIGSQSRRGFSSGNQLTTYTESDSSVAFITLNNPAKRNALSLAMLTELQQQFAKVNQNNHIRVVVLKANGHVFSSGIHLHPLFS
jgi:hypothetical protein